MHGTCSTKLNEETQEYYFNEGYEYEVILCFLLKYHEIVEMSRQTLKERLSYLAFEDAGLLDSNNQDVRTRIQEEFDGPRCLSGYRSMWNTLHCEGY